MAVVLPFVNRQSGSHPDKAEAADQSGIESETYEETDGETAGIPERRRSSKKRPRRVLIAGAGAVGHALAEQLDADARYTVVGFVDDDVALFGVKDWPILGPKSATSHLVRQHAIDEVFVAYAPTWQQELMDDIVQGNLPVSVRVVPSYYEAMLCAPQIGSVGDVALINLVTSGAHASDWAKRAFDFLASLVGLVLLSPLVALVAVVIAVTSPGPILFVQERVGRGGKKFNLIKFRTMRVDAEKTTGPVLSEGKFDARLTPIGRWMRLFRLDELPQLINVLRGEMSLVGPRPERPVFVEQFTQRNPVYARRHHVRPGITGLAQVHGGYHTDARDKLRFDLFYVSHRSLWLDLTVLWRTVLNTICRPDGC